MRWVARIATPPTPQVVGPDVYVKWERGRAIVEEWRALLAPEA